MLQSATRLLDRLDRTRDWQFILILYLVRWVVLSPFLVLLFREIRHVRLPYDSDKTLAIYVALIVSPILETLVECSIPYALLRKRIHSSSRSWLFIGVSGLTMMLFHPYVVALLPSFITGVFLAYTYAHFAPRNTVAAILFTSGFHAGINLVGVIASFLS